MTETNSTNKCCRSCILHPKNNDELDYQPGVRCGNPSCICHQPKAPHGVEVVHAHPVTQSKEGWEEKFVMWGNVLQFRDAQGIRNANVEDISAALRTELESLLQEMPKDKEVPIPIKSRMDEMLANINLQGEAIGFNAALSTIREVISKRLSELK